jgi:hypothetical protein
VLVFVIHPRIDRLKNPLLSVIVPLPVLCNSIVMFEAGLPPASYTFPFILDVFFLAEAMRDGHKSGDVSIR